MESLIVAYNPEWKVIFKKIKLELESTLYGLDYKIEHVGSTSVPQLASKPIIDIDIIYEERGTFEEIKSRLQNIGYFHNGNQGIEAREVFKRSGLMKHAVLDFEKHHLYVCPSTSKALRRHIAFRDALRSNEFARLAYQNMKYAIAEKANQDKKVYAHLKEQVANDFIDELIKDEARANGNFEL